MKSPREKVRDVNVIHLKGNLTFTTAQEFFSQMASLMEQGEKNFLLETSSLKSIDSIGLGTIVRLSKRIKEAKGKLKFSNLNPKVMQLFELTKLDAIFEIHETQEEALKDF